MSSSTTPRLRSLSFVDLGSLLFIVSLMLVLGIVPSVRLPWTIRRATVGQGISG